MSIPLTVWPETHFDDYCNEFKTGYPSPKPTLGKKVIYDAMVAKLIKDMNEARRLGTINLPDKPSSKVYLAAAGIPFLYTTIADAASYTGSGTVDRIVLEMLNGRITQRTAFSLLQQLAERSPQFATPGMATDIHAARVVLYGRSYELTVEGLPRTVALSVEELIQLAPGRLASSAAELEAMYAEAARASTPTTRVPGMGRLLSTGLLAIFAGYELFFNNPTDLAGGEDNFEHTVFRLLMSIREQMRAIQAINEQFINQAACCRCKYWKQETVDNPLGQNGQCTNHIKEAVNGSSISNQCRTNAFDWCASYSAYVPNNGLGLSVSPINYIPGVCWEWAPNGIPTAYSFTVAGVVNGADDNPALCSACTKFNGDWVVSTENRSLMPAGCTPGNGSAACIQCGQVIVPPNLVSETFNACPLQAAPCGPCDFCYWSMRFDGNTTDLVCVIDAYGPCGRMATYDMPEDWSPYDVGVFTLETPLPQDWCNTFPATITISPLR